MRKLLFFLSFFTKLHSSQLDRAIECILANNLDGLQTIFEESRNPYSLTSYVCETIEADHIETLQPVKEFLDQKKIELQKEIEELKHRNPVLPKHVLEWPKFGLFEPLVNDDGKPYNHSN